MTTYSGYNTGAPPMMWFFMVCGAVVLLLLSMMGSAAVQVAPPNLTPERVGGVDIDKVVEEIRSLGELPPGSEPVYLNSTGGLLRVYSGWKGQLFITGHEGAPGLLAAAEKIAAIVGAIVAPY